ncbi:MAG: 3D domain-containing protein [bacterium]|nr:3D domain-containing protein [bacterium]
MKVRTYILGTVSAVLLCTSTLIFPAFAQAPSSSASVSGTTESPAVLDTTPPETFTGPALLSNNIDGNQETEKETDNDEEDEQKDVSSAVNPESSLYLGKFTITAYCTCELCTSGEGLTYMGTKPKANHTISADLSRYPLGTRLIIDGIVYTVEDCGSGVNENHIDIYMDTHEAAEDYGLQTKEVYQVQN